MHSSENLERFYFQYQIEGLPKGISIQDFCINNKVPTLRQHLTLQLEKLKTEPKKVSSYLKEAVNYLNKFWNKIFAYLKDGK